VEAPTEAFEPDVSKWEAWHPAEAAARLAGVGVPWAVAAGWALDLFRGRQTREHEDLEIVVPEDGLRAIVDALSEFEFFAVGDGRARPLTARALERTHQTWVRERYSGVWRVDVVREPWNGDTWICRRDPRLRRPRSEVIAYSTDGIPYQQPEIALLFKAKHAREKDQADFDGVLPLLAPHRRAWLANALELVHPGHPWIEAARTA
jgi:hypothetical protein